MRKEYAIAVGKSRLETQWRNRAISWGDLVKRLSSYHRTLETASAYKAMNKTQKGNVKDKGGFVGGALIADGPRKGTTIKSRSLLTLDIDFGTKDSIALIEDTFLDVAWCLYSTHSHTPETPRYRLIVPLSRDVMPDEYIPIGRKIAQRIGIDQFDDSTYVPSRLMYWPSCPCDIEPVFEVREGSELDVDEVLSSYADWRNVEEWPSSSREQKLVKTNRHKQQEDPVTKPGLIGAFCRQYGIARAIATFLPDVYEATAHEDRYTFVGGTTQAGAIVYDDKFLYSHHGTDPCCEKLVNAFDLVRIHKFGEKDENCAEGTPVNKIPSFIAMEEFAGSLKDVKVDLLSSRRQTAEQDFGSELPSAKGGNDWMALLRTDKKGVIISCPHNFRIICENDENLKDTVKHDEFLDKNFIVRRLPWRNADPKSDTCYWTDTDDAGLVDYLNQAPYEVTGKQAIVDAHDLVMSNCSYHPIRDYFSTLKWDGIHRLDTMIIDYLGADDDAAGLTRLMTRKHFTAAVARVMNPGVKYDYVLTLSGPEGVGKSTLIRKMGMQWFDDSFSSNDVGDKQAMEQLRGRWLVELGELKEYKRNTIEAFKAFITKQQDEYRPAYGRKCMIYPRQCVFFATTNEINFLKGDTGNRRFWAIEVHRNNPTKSVFDLSQSDIDQLWAEALECYKNKEPLFLDEHMEKAARTRQDSYNELASDDRLGIIESFIRQDLPSNWYKLSRRQRAEFFRLDKKFEDASDFGITRDYICATEVGIECFGKDMNRYELREINQLLKRIDGLEYAGNIRTKDEVYGSQRRYKIKDEFWRK